MKRIFILFVILLFVAGTLSAAAADKKMTFGMLSHEIGSGFFAPHMQAAKDFEKTYGVNVEFLAPEQWNIGEHVNMLENMVAKKVDGLATTVVDPNAYRDVVKRALDSGIPVVSYNNDDPNGSDRMAYIGQYDDAAGIEAAKQLLKYMGGADAAKGKKVLLFICCPGFAALEVRAAAAKETLEAAGVKVKGPIEYTANPSEVYGNIEAAYLANPDASGFLSVDAFTSVMSTFIAKNKLQKKIKAGGWDLLPDTMTGIAKGSLQFTIGSNAYITAYYALTSLYFMATKGIPPVSIDTGVTIVDSTNITEYTKMAKEERK